MLSICIPIYNTNCNKLIDDLNTQISKENIAIEVICIDDKSTDEWRKQNENLAKKCNYILLEQNIGRAKIRNKFLEFAKYDWFLFLDNDAIVSSNDYLEKYITQINNSKALVICGATHFLKPETFNIKNSLCYKISCNAEKQVLINRSQSNHSSFMTNNVVIKKQVLQQIKFDETLVNYGHEDTLFGFKLQQNSTFILYIDNTVNCIASDSNEEFILKTKHAINNLVYITQQLHYDANFIKSVRLLKTYFKSKKIALKSLSFILCNLTEMLLKNGFVSLRLYSFYKLLLLSKTNL
ncbi:MAG: glycosyltransferase family 2 protein [Bacteroidetes bacterium]|nr:glycosyltransferase family 2 protein [Bacteroidota bacterium]